MNAPNMMEPEGSLPHNSQPPVAINEIYRTQIKLRPLIF